MRMILRYESGLRVEAVLLAIDSRRVRVAVDSADDARMFVRADDYWYGEDGEVVELEAAVADEGDDIAAMIDAMKPKVMTAGGCGVS
jgi:hypothetical protein